MLFLARLGVRHFTILSRSGDRDLRSKQIVQNLEMLGGQTVLIQGDVSKLDDVRRAFDSATAPVDGIINGAMVLKVCQHTHFEILIGIDRSYNRIRLSDQ